MKVPRSLSSDTTSTPFRLNSAINVFSDASSAFLSTAGSGVSSGTDASEAFGLLRAEGGKEGGIGELVLSSGTRDEGIGVCEFVQIPPFIVVILTSTDT